MFALSNRPFRNAGLALYGLGSLASLGLVSNQASAQTLANNNQPSAGITRSDACAHLTKDYSPKGIETYVACELREIDRRTSQLKSDTAAIERNTAQTKRETAAIKASAQRETACQDVLIKGIEGGTIKPATVNAIYGDRPVGSIPACTVLERLAKG